MGETRLALHHFNQLFSYYTLYMYIYVYMYIYIYIYICYIYIYILYLLILTLINFRLLQFDATAGRERR